MAAPRSSRRSHRRRPTASGT